MKQKYILSNLKYLNVLIRGLKCLLCVFVCQYNKDGWTYEFVHGLIYTYLWIYIDIWYTDYLKLYIYIILVSLWVCMQNDRNWEKLLTILFMLIRRRYLVVRCYNIVGCRLRLSNLHSKKTCCTIALKYTFSSQVFILRLFNWIHMSLNLL